MPDREESERMAGLSLSGLGLGLGFAACGVMETEMSPELVCRPSRSYNGQLPVMGPEVEEASMTRESKA